MTKGQISLIIVLSLIVCLLVVLTLQLRDKRNQADTDPAYKLLASALESDSFIDITGNKTVVDPKTAKITVVTVWASWSPYSVQDLQILNALAVEFKDQPVAFVAVNRKEPPHQAQRFLDTVGDLPNLKLVIDTTDEFYFAAEGYTMPETVIYDQNGVIVSQIKGAIRAEDLKVLLSDNLSNQ